MDWISLSLALCMGIALSAACGLRVFMPLLVLAVGCRWFGVPMAQEMVWLHSDAALLCLAVATVLEFLGYYIPVVDNSLDALQTPLALVAGILVMSGVLVGQPDWLQWGVGVIGGAGIAGGVQTLTAALRLGSTATTGGVGNPLLSTAENILAFVGAVLALVAPLLAVLGLALLVFVVCRLVRRIRCRRMGTSEADAPSSGGGQ